MPAARKARRPKRSRPSFGPSTLDVNLTGAFLSVQPALAGMRERHWGRIIFIASTAGLKAYAYVAPYVAAKHGVVGLTRALALETAKDGITVNAVCPATPKRRCSNTPSHRIVATTKAQRSRGARGARGQQSAGPLHPAAGGRRRGAVAVRAKAAPAITGQAISVSGGETW